jgi:choline dehydrogenase-like flavoprotein
MLPYFKRAEDNERGESEFHGAGGPLPVSEGRSNNPLVAAFVEAGQAVGYPLNDDFNGATQEGVGFYQATQRNGLRASTAVAYLHPVSDRPNLTIETHVLVSRVVIEGGRAVGVEGLRLDQPLSFRAEREVILSAGAYNSPQLLMLSGVGRPDELTMLQIEPVHELPGVGMNMQDHCTAGGSWLCDQPVSLKDALTPENVALLEQEGRGPLTSCIAEGGGFIHTREGLPAPDIQYHMVPVVFADEGLAPPPDHGFTLGACLLKPRSRGQLIVTSPDPTAKPMIVHNFLTDPDDLTTLSDGVRTVLELVRTAPLSDFNREPFLAPEGDSDAQIEDYVRANCQTLYHPVGTCAMGAGEEAVVDAELRVRGLDGLRVVDASVMPTLTRGNTNAPVIAIAEKAADLIRGVSAPAEAAATAEPAAV